MKLAGITWWRNNYGSILQAYALQTYLETLDGIEYEILCQYGKEIGSFDNLLDKLKRYGLFETVNRIIWRFGIPQLRNRSGVIQRFVEKNLNVSKRQYTESTIGTANNLYDGFICGSDQIWNPTLTDTNSMYWLTFANDDKIRVAYAPSIGVEALSESQKRDIVNNLNHFNAISCREESGTQLINSVLGQDRCKTVLDPTLMVSKRVWDNICTKTCKKEKYIFVYMLRGTRKQRRMVEDFAAKKKLKILTMPFLDTEHIVWYDSKFGDKKIWAADPADFISLIKNAEFVVTDSFHCMVFSCLYHKTFFAFRKIGASQHNRMVDLQNLVGIENRIMEESDSVIEEEKFGTINWSQVDEKLENARTESRNYLLAALGLM